MPVFEFPPTFAQLESLNQSQVTSSEQDLINAHILTKLAQLEARLNESNSKGDSGDILPPN